jgi:hypothetical protein
VVKTFIAGSPIYIIHIGLGLIPKGRFIPSGLFSPFTRGLHNLAFLALSTAYSQPIVRRHLGRGFP